MESGFAFLGPVRSGFAGRLSDAHIIEVNSLEVVAMNRTKSALAVLGIVAAMLFPGLAAQATDVMVYKTPWCGCCDAWIDHLRENGFSVSVTERDDLTAVREQQGVPAALQSCHTAIVDGYVVEGHVPAADVRRLLNERPQATGLAVPGMPMGSPGMEQGDLREPYASILFGPDGSSVYVRH